MRLIRRKTLTVLMLLMGSAMLLAQFQVNNAVNNRVNTELYGASTGSVKYSNTTSVPMQSEVRYAYRAAGATPSEVRMNAAAIGPLAPGGSIAYIPTRPSWQDSQAANKHVAPAAQGAAAFSTGSVRNATLPASPNQIILSPLRSPAGASVNTPAIQPTSVNPFAVTNSNMNINHPIPKNPNTAFAPATVSGSIRYP